MTLVFDILELDDPQWDRTVNASHIEYLTHKMNNSKNASLIKPSIKRELANRDLMAKTVQKYLTLHDAKTPLKDKLFTASLLALTMMGILLLFWYQNFGPGLEAFMKHYDTTPNANH